MALKLVLLNLNSSASTSTTQLFHILNLNTMEKEFLTEEELNNLPQEEPMESPLAVDDYMDDLLWAHISDLNIM